MRWNQVTIVGTGLIGGSLGLALKAGGLAGRVVGVGHRPATLDRARACGAADVTTLDLVEGVRGSDLVVLATAVGLFERLLAQAAEALAPGAVVIDVGSTKGEVVRRLEPLVPPGRAFLGCHPIAGSEKRGIDHARADLFRGAVCVLTPTPRTPPEALARVSATWKALGMRILVMDPEAHDRLLAEASHLPHVVAAALARTLRPEAAPLTGTGWADTTRVAGGDPGLWRDIVMTNREGLLRALGRLEGALAEFRRAVETGDEAAVERFLAEAKAARDRVAEG